MTHRSGSLRILLTVTALCLAGLGGASVARAADAPVATAPIPPPLPVAPADKPYVVNANPARSAKPPLAVAMAPKKPAHTASRVHAEHLKLAATHRSRTRQEHHRQLAHVYAPRETPPPRRYYPSEYMPGPVASEGPSYPPPWYNTAPPPTAYYPGPRGMGRPW
ncbi:MAG TPA: hypothetical protein VHW90_06985 [Stellaceae bacterium]|jgi:hypothetical protein|nr:hypothetical protein [Stellaceae bacterium]